MIRRLIRAVPLLGSWLGRLPSATAPHDGAADAYWQARYADGGDSGGGSFGAVARFKAETLNARVAEFGIRSVIEFGCGDGAQLALARYPTYLGLDVAPAAIERCRRRFGGDPDRRFELYVPDRFDPTAPGHRAELALSLDVLYHLVDDARFDAHLAHVFGAATRCVIIFSSDFDRVVARHVRHRHFTGVVAERFPHWRLRERIATPYPRTWLRRSGSLADFFVYEPRAGMPEAAEPVSGAEPSPRS